MFENSEFKTVLGNPRTKMAYDTLGDLTFAAEVTEFKSGFRSYVTFSPKEEAFPIPITLFHSKHSSYDDAVATIKNVTDDMYFSNLPYRYRYEAGKHVG